ncbi:hypothetical protein [Bacillus mycoides]|uniref:hypothetical protein n=1 Tax=Bacillus mycoides TaxID=1405 RepID=UPI0008156743|nr:hypothetical protein [Bacillus mycoides]SCC37772.1 Protein of unknown function [Bacillus mycoides]
MENVVGLARKHKDTLVGNGVAFLVALSQSILDCLEVDSVKGVSNEQMTIFQFI